MADVLIRNATILDGTGAPPRAGDIGIESGRIAFVGENGAGAETEIDAEGLTAAPGFIDIHTHSDYTLLLDGRAMSAVCQGVTTHVSGNCGISAFPVGDDGPYLGPFESARLREALTPTWGSAAGYFDALEARGTAINAAFFVGHGAVRQAVMGQRADAPSPSELRRMRALVDAQMREGALGLTTGLTYMPGSAASTEEIVDLTAAVAPYGGIYATHMRNYNAGILEALEEAIAIGREAGVPVHVSHITPCPPATGSAHQLLDRMARARAEGLDVTAETEFYATGSTSLKSLLPPWALAGGNGPMLARLREPATRERMWQEIREKGSELGGSTKTVLMQQAAWDRLWLGNCSVNARLTGKSFDEIGRIRKTHPFQAVCDILLEEESAASFYGQDKSEADIDALAQDPHCGLGSDGLAMASDGPLGREREHPRCYGGMAYLIRTLVRERRAMPLADLVCKVTEFPARRMGLRDRGRLAPGLRADVVLFDAETITDGATLTNPCVYSSGVVWSFVNGEAILADGRPTGRRPGLVLKGTGAEG